MRRQRAGPSERHGVTERWVVLDTETTGLEVRDGHRIIEIGAIEIVGRRRTDRLFHQYVNPERECDEGALSVHGINREFLDGKPKFCEIADDLIEFVSGAEIIIHNAPFDVEFLDAELTRIGRNRLTDYCVKVTCSLQHAREQHPGKRNSLDALCERYAVSNAHRTLHGALLDAGLLAEVFLSMTRGQDSLVIDVLDDDTLLGNFGAIDVSSLLAVVVSNDETAAHEALLDTIAREAKLTPVWRLELYSPTVLGEVQ
ncbi:MAG: DNA polymerase III subunit epsilon [Burkholderiaceae bacterium]|nr:DNA polymerase III subunit epsilon [Burkholderiaceae bacterium]